MEECKIEKITNVAPQDVSIEMKDCAFSWGFRVAESQAGALRGKVLIEERNDTVIEDINFNLKHDDLLVCVGMVGCGKSTLLASVMEETRLMKGKRAIKGTVAYVE